MLLCTWWGVSVLVVVCEKTSCAVQAVVRSLNGPAEWQTAELRAQGPPVRAGSPICCVGRSTSEKHILQGYHSIHRSQALTGGLQALLGSHALTPDEGLIAHQRSCTAPIPEPGGQYELRLNLLLPLRL